MEKKFSFQITIIFKSKTKKKLDLLLENLLSYDKNKKYFQVDSFVFLSKRKKRDLSYFKAPHANHKNSQFKAKFKSQTLSIKISYENILFFNKLISLCLNEDICVYFK
jgi:hypothetical protein